MLKPLAGILWDLFDKNDGKLPNICFPKLLKPSWQTIIKQMVFQVSLSNQAGYFFFFSKHDGTLSKMCYTKNDYPPPPGKETLADAGDEDERGGGK